MAQIQKTAVLATAEPASKLSIWGISWKVHARLACGETQQRGMGERKELLFSAPRGFAACSCILTWLPLLVQIVEHVRRLGGAWIHWRVLEYQGCRMFLGLGTGYQLNTKSMHIITIIIIIIIIMIMIIIMIIIIIAFAYLTKGIIDTFSCGLVLTLSFCTFCRLTVHEIWPSQWQWSESMKRCHITCQVPKSV